MYHSYKGVPLSPNSTKLMPRAFSSIAAGDPSESTDDYELIDVNELITKGKEGFLIYTVTGDSMVEFIKHGYIVFVDPYSQPEKGDIIASCVNGKHNVKYFEKSKNGLFLISANKKYKPQLITESDTFHLLGVVKGHLAVY